ncbi:nicotinate-nucleotide--dimethylbenzimidazole phosphoribosyltransferase [Shewanella salipaludis]|uniref:Nicotinate-nucleotide--dimethylbenzimidazole phosphoribosyltransferase n=1 Tax=Shewanella salipaludis TaxID=2723052 RepID=A0A972FTG8_9GAMM|nr:nicotinate-nucleotide--dimethylbenzimidazole phosphoribosyltransferase [Shewanella salipaludis]NMH64924.1 nicotinate-nucleotide--dimethylbenzimidazole phosphoribosyltransferase [Shewanella salipaludis]
MFNIPALSHAGDAEIQHRIDHKTKPPGALGELEPLALQLARVLGKEAPAIRRPTMLVFAADHGIAAHGVSIAPSAVTTQMVHNFLGGGAAINVFCRQLGYELEVIDCGILEPLPPTPGLVAQRLGAGTGAIHLEAAMTQAQVTQGLALARALVARHHEAGANLIALGEMGIGNTSSAAAVMAALTGLPLTDCVGRGTGIDDAALANKRALLARALALHGDEPTSGQAQARPDPLRVLACLGGFEIVQMTGAMLAAAELGMLVLVDGFIATVSALLAVRLNANARDYMIFAHESEERGHKLLLAELGARPLLSLGLRLGEGTGAALALPLVQAAANFYNQMASFDEAGVTSVV